MNRRMSGNELGALIFCVAALVVCLAMMAFPLWDFATKPYSRSQIGNVLSAIFLFVVGLVGFVLYIWVFIVLTRRIIDVTADSGGVMVKPRFGKPIRINPSLPPRAYSVRTVPYLEVPSQKALLVLRPSLFFVVEIDSAWEELGNLWRRR